MTVTTTRPDVRAVHADGHVFPVGTPVPNVTQSTIEALERLPRVHVDVAGKDQPDADTPEPITEE